MELVEQVQRRPHTDQRTAASPPEVGGFQPGERVAWRSPSHTAVSLEDPTGKLERDASSAAGVTGQEVMGTK